MGLSFSVEESNKEVPMYTSKTRILFFRGNGRQFRAFLWYLQAIPGVGELRLTEMRSIEVR